MPACSSVPRLPRVVAKALVAAALSLLACDSRPATTGPTAAPACPQCVCNCMSPDATVTPELPTTPPPTTGASDEVRVLAANITRKVAKRDATCVADLERLKKLSPRDADAYEIFRGQCLMVAGRCADGSSIVRKQLGDTTDMLAEQLDRAVEQYAMMYCTGPLDDRSEVLRALFELQKGGYQGNIGVRACTDAAKTVIRLRSRVRPKDDEDYQILNLESVLPTAAAACLGRAGDCAGAWKIFNEEFTSLRGIADPKVRADAMRTSFDSIVPKCKGKP